MSEELIPDFIGLAKTSIEIFHPEVLDFPDDIIQLAIEYKALKLEESYKAMLLERKR